MVMVLVYLSILLGFGGTMTVAILMKRGLRHALTLFFVAWVLSTVAAVLGELSC